MGERLGRCGEFGYRMGLGWKEKGEVEKGIESLSLVIFLGDGGGRERY